MTAFVSRYAAPFMMSLVCAALLCATARAEDFPSLLDRAAALSEAAKADSVRFPDADTVLVADFEKIKYNPDGTAKKWDEAYEKVLTEKGKRDLMTVSVDFTLPYTKVSVPFVEVVKPDGRTLKVDIERNSREMVDRSQMGANIYNPNDKVLQVAVPGLETGDVVHYMIFRDEVKQRMAGTWCDYFVLECQNPMLRYEIEIEAPDSLPLVIRVLRDEVKGTVSYSSSKKDGATVHKWVAKDVPRIFEEPAMPPYYTVVQRLLVSTIPDWQTISKWYWGISLPHLEKTTPGMKAKVAELLAEAGGDKAKRLEAIFHFVSQKIRYMGITTEELSPGYEPHDVDVTFENKYGVCRDKAALLVAMLRLAGFDAYPVLINNGPKKDPDAPQPYFNHAISCVRNGDGSYTLMDPTDESAVELLPAYLCDKSYLVARPEGETLKTSPIIPAEKNLLRISTEGTVDDSGSLKASSVLDFDGINDNAYRGYFSRIRPEERRLFFEGRLKQAIKGAVLESLSISPESMTDTSKPLQAKISYSVKDFLVRGKEESILPLPWLGTNFGMVNFIIGQTGLAQRRFPLDSEIACGVKEQMNVGLGSAIGKALAIPKCGKIDSPTLSWGEEVSLEEGGLRGEAAFLIKTVEFSPEQYLALKEALKLIESDRRKSPIFASAAASAKALSSSKAAAPAEPSPDAAILDEDVKIELRGQDSWTLARNSKKKILTYAGKKRNSEIKINYNPIWESVEVKATVSSPNGELKTLGEKEVNIMDAPWVGSAPRYPAGKTLVASLPGVDVGSIVECRVSIEAKGHHFFSAIESFQGYEPIESKTVAISGAKGLLASLKFSIEPDEKGEGLLVWKASKVPALRPEDSLPPSWAYVKTLLVSNGDWQAFAGKARDAMLAASKGQAKSAELAAKLCAGASGPEEKIARIRDFVAKSIKMNGPDFGDLPWDCMSAADRTLADGYGNSADCAILLRSMLAAASFEPEFVVASQYPDLKEVAGPICGFPQFFAFKAPLVKVSQGGREICLNDTDQYAALGTVSHSGSPALSLDGARIGALKAAAPDLEDGIEETWDLTLRPDGSAAISKQVKHYGDDYAGFHKNYAEMTPEKRRRHFQEMVASIAQSAKADGDLKTDFKSYPGVLSFKVEVPDFAVRDGKFLYFQLPEDGMANLFKLRSESRTAPFYRASAQKVALTFNILLPEGVEKLSISPEPFNWASSSGMGAASISPSQSGRKVSVSCKLDLKPSLTPAAAYGELKTLHSVLSSPATNTMLVSE